MFTFQLTKVVIGYSASLSLSILFFLFAKSLTQWFQRSVGCFEAQKSSQMLTKSPRAAQFK